MESRVIARTLGRMTVVVCLLSAACSDVTVVVGKYGRPVGGRGGAAGESGAIDSDAAVAGREARDAEVESGAAGAPAPNDDVSPAPRVPLSPDPPDVVRIDDSPRDAFCAGGGLPLRIERPAGAPADCGARLAPKLFAHALCSCEDLSLAASAFVADAYDSRQGDHRPGGGGASIGVNRSISRLAIDTQVSGSLFVAGTSPLQLGSTRFTVGGDFRINATLETTAPSARIARDLWVAGDLHGPPGTLAVGRDAYRAEGRTGAEVLRVTGRSVTSSGLQVRPPCDCDERSRLDIAALVEQARADNDNVAAGWSASALRIDPLVGDEVTLPCGRLFADEISLPDVSTFYLNYSGRTALFVAGDFTIGFPATFFVQRVGGGELDIFVAGNLRVASTLWIGTDADPAAVIEPATVRMYVAGQVTVTGAVMLAGQLYAPNATIDWPMPTPDLHAYGSIYARSIRQLSFAQLHYDRAIVATDRACTAPSPQRCDGCYQCAGDLACIAGSCAPCARDTDCCGPAVCSNGTCQPLPP